VKKLTLVVDDTPVTNVCGAEMSAKLPALSTGMHTVDVVAEVDGGKTTTRRLNVFAGDAFLDEVSTRFDNGATVVGFRDLAPDAMNAKVRVQVLDDKKNVVTTTEMKSSNGPVAWNFDGKKAGKYTAHVEIVDDAGKVRDAKDVVFSHESYEAQRAKYAEVSGAVALPEGGASSNAEVELVDDKGNVLQRTATTKSGQYRFQNVDAGKYKVRVKKQGFKDEEQKLDAKAGYEAAAPAVAPARQ